MADETTKCGPIRHGSVTLLCTLPPGHDGSHEAVSWQPAPARGR
jgi:hypothetical protein